MREGHREARHGGPSRISSLRSDCLDGAAAVWSMWAGYLDEPSGTRLRHWLNERDIPLTVARSSRHATVRDLLRLAAAIGADQVVPIHTSRPYRYEDLFDGVRAHLDGEWWTV